MAQLRSGDNYYRGSDAKVGPPSRPDLQSKLLFRPNQRLIAGYPSDSPVSTTDEEWEAEDLSSNLKSVILTKRGTSLSRESSVGEENYARSSLMQQFAASSGGSGARTNRRHWAPGEGVINRHLFLLDDRPWQEFYTLFYIPVYIIVSICLLEAGLLLVFDGTLGNQPLILILVPCATLFVGVFINLLFVCVFPIPNCSSSPAYDNWADPFNQQ